MKKQIKTKKGTLTIEVKRERPTFKELVKYSIAILVLAGLVYYFWR